MIRNEKGFLLVVAIHIIGLLAFMGTAAMIMTRLDLKMTSNYKNHAKSHYVSDAATQYAKKALAFTDPNPITWSSTSFLGADFITITVTPDSIDPDIATIAATTELNGSLTSVELKVLQFFPPIPGVLGGITSNGPIEVNGSLIIDGRDHDTNCTVLPGAGVPGVYTNATIDQGGSADIGGYAGGIDYVPSDPGDPAIITEGGTEAVDTPDAAIGIPEGTLKSLAQRGIGGSQYITNPANLVLPLQGVTYVELPSGDTWMSQNDLTNGSGVLVVHNSDTNAILENTNGGTFTGLVITDDIIHLHNQIIGALITLTSTPSAGNVLGNGTGSVCYSSAAINGLGFLTQIQELSWREL